MPRDIAFADYPDEYNRSFSWPSSDVKRRVEICKGFSTWDKLSRFV